MAIKSYQDLEVWQLAMQLAKEAYAIAAKLPSEERYALSDQIRKAAVSIPSNIAEGFERGSASDFIRFLHIAQGSRAELETQVQLSIMTGYISDLEIETLSALIKSVGRMINALIKTLNERKNK